MEEDFPQVREVDMKLIELAKVYNCKIVTNDFNLNKVAQVRGVEVLNINELANALKPIVLPGELMRVFILKEGKEYNQGVAYLDDGTMVVVDNARRMISKTIDISVTSVLQTTAGQDDFRQVRRAQSHGAAPERALSRAARRGTHGAARRVGNRQSEKADPVKTCRHSAGRRARHPDAARHRPPAAETTGTSRKQFMLLEGAPILVHTVRKFVASPLVHDIVVAVREEDIEWVDELLHEGRRADCSALCRWWRAATRRQESVENALARARSRYGSGGGARRGAAVHRSRTIRRVVEEAEITRRGDCGHRAGGYGEAGERRAGGRRESAGDDFARASGAGADSAGFSLRYSASAPSRRRGATTSPAPMNRAWWSVWIRWRSAWCSAATATSRSPGPSDMDLARLFFEQETGKRVE